MNTTTKPPLNEGQLAAAKGVFEFLLSDEKEMIISGPAGSGKTFLVADIVDRVIPEYQTSCKMLGIPPTYDEVMMTATTNKASEVLHEAIGRPTQTIHSFMNLVIKEDFKTGRVNLIPSKSWKVHQNVIIFVDEAFVIDSDLRRFINEGTLNCKIIYVGDHCQLGPVMENISPIHTAGLRTYVLTKSERNKGQPALMALCNQLRETVETGVFRPIKIVPGIIDLLDGPSMEKEIESRFLDMDIDSRILAYSNARVIDYNDHVRHLRALPNEYTTGEVLISNSAIRFGENRISVEEEITIAHIHTNTDTVDLDQQIQFDVFKADIVASGRLIRDVKIPKDRKYFTDLVKYFARLKNWSAYFDLKNNYPDFRQRDAQTVHKSQGSTYKTTFIDAENLSTCNNPIVAARLLYVGVSRSSERVVFYGNLAEKYGGFVK